MIWNFVFSATPPSFAQYMGGIDSQQEELGEYIGLQVSDPKQQLAQRIENDQNNAILVLVIGIPSFALMIGFIIWRKRK